MSETGGASYALGHSEREMERLSMQARVYEPFTRRMLEQAGVSPGMGVLDVGSGMGDVTFLCASMVGPSGHVTGIDRAPAAVETARRRAQSAGIGNVEFLAGDPTGARFESPFDVVVGRLVLMHQPDPAAMLRKLSGLLRPGGIIAFQELDMSGVHSHPPCEIFERCLAWVEAAFATAGADTRTGGKLFSVFREAGLPKPTMSLDAGIWGGDDNPAAIMVADVIRSLLPAIERAGIATAEQVGIDSLQARVQREISDRRSVAVTPYLIGAWTKLA